MLNIKEEKKDNFYLLILKNTEFKIDKDYDKLVKVSQNIGKQLYQNGQYEVQSKVTNDNFKSFLDYWMKDIHPNINNNNIYDFYLLSKEFGIMKEIVNLPDFQQKLKYSLLISLSTNQGDNSETIKYVSKNLDDYLKRYPKLMYKIPYNHLHSIFYNDERVLIDHERAYKFIIGNPDNPNIYILLESIDGFKLTTKSFLESISKRADHYGHFPNIRPQDADLIIRSLPNEISSFDGTLKELIESKISKKVKEEESFDKKITIKKFFYEIFKMLSLMLIASIILISSPYFFHFFFKVANSNIFIRNHDTHSQEEAKVYNENYDKFEIKTSNIINEVMNQLEIEISKNKPDSAKLLINLKNNIKNGNLESLTKCGILFQYGHDVKKNAALATCIYKYLADLGNPNAMMRYALCRKKGIGCNINITESEIYMKKAATKGILRAIYHYALILYDGSLGQIDKITASYYFKMGADKMHLKCIKKYADMINEGDGIKANKEEAAYYYKLGSDLNDLNSTLKYIKFLKTKKIDVDNMKEIAIYTKKASDLGDLDSMCDFALMLLNGYGVEINEKEAALLMKKAADRGHIKSKLKYGLMLLKGIGVDSDEVKGIEYIKAAKHYNGGALYYLNCIKEHLSFDEYIDKELKLEEFDDIILSFVPYSLGIEIINDEMLFLTPRNSCVPIKTSKIVTTVVDNQTTATINIYAGENSKVSQNIFIGTFNLNDIPPAPKGTPSIEVTFEVFPDGTVHVSASEKSSGKYEEKSFKIPIRSRFLR